MEPYLSYLLNSSIWIQMVNLIDQIQTKQMHTMQIILHKMQSKQTIMKQKQFGMQVCFQIIYIPFPFTTNYISIIPQQSKHMLFKWCKLHSLHLFYSRRLNNNWGHLNDRYTVFTMLWYCIIMYIVVCFFVSFLWFLKTNICTD